MYIRCGWPRIEENPALTAQLGPQKFLGAGLEEAGIGGLVKTKILNHK